MTTTLVLTHIPDSREEIGDRLRQWAEAMAWHLYPCSWQHTLPDPTITLGADEDEVREVAALYLDGIGVAWEIAGEVAA